jgi:ribA/ribD-fused uncharacterized protein
VYGKLWLLGTKRALRSGRRAAAAVEGMSSGRRVVLITHGSMNPIHKGHLQMMARARSALEADGYQVVGGEIAIARQTHLAGKGVPAMPDALRLRLIDAACAAAGHSWLRAVDGSHAKSANQFISREAPRWRRAYNGPVNAVSVEGSDVFLRYPPRAAGAERVIVVREDDVDAVAHALHESAARFGLVARLIVAEEHRAVSSTAAREALLRRDRPALVIVCGAAVADILMDLPLEAVFVVAPDLSAVGVPQDTPTPGMRTAPGASLVEALPAGALQPTAGTMAEGSADLTTADELVRRWRALGDEHRHVLGFYGHGERAGAHAAFSNFYTHEPVSFAIPECCASTSLRASGRASAGFSFMFSEKAIMLCKAAAMGDYVTFDQINAASTPAEAKALGRKISPFDQARWDGVVCSVAYAALLAKFDGVAELGRLLLATGDALIAEATRNDRIWGIGVDVGDPDMCVPARWRGANILGWALMEVRRTLKVAQRHAA